MRENWKPRQESERNCGMMGMKLDKDHFCSQGENYCISLTQSSSGLEQSLKERDI